MKNSYEGCVPNEAHDDTSFILVVYQIKKDKTIYHVLHV